MTKPRIIERLPDPGIVAVIRVEGREVLLPIGEALPPRAAMLALLAPA